MTSSLSFTVLESPEPGTYNIVGGFTNGEFRQILPKTNYYSFGLGAKREASDNVYMPGNNSPRLKETMNMPGPGEYNYSNFCIGKEGRKWQFLKRTKNPLGKFIRIIGYLLQNPKLLCKSKMSQDPAIMRSLE